MSDFSNSDFVLSTWLSSSSMSTPRLSIIAFLALRACNGKIAGSFVYPNGGPFPSGPNVATCPRAMPAIFPTNVSGGVSI